MPGTLQYAGDGSLKFGPIISEYGPKGMTTRFTVTCPTVGPLVAYYNYIVTWGASGVLKGLDRSNDNTLSAADKELEVSLPGLVNNYQQFISELFFDSWELLSNEKTDSIFSNPLIVGNASGGAGWMTDNDKVVLSWMARNGGTLAQSVSACNAMCNATPQSLPYPTLGGTGASPSQYQAPSNAKSVQLVLEIMKGQTEYEKPTYVLRHTSYCSASALYNSSRNYVEHIYTPAQLLTEVGTGWTYNLPPRLYSEISQIPIEYAPALEASYYQWGWLKRKTREVVQANFVVQIETEYECGLWSNIRYASR